MDLEIRPIRPDEFEAYVRTLETAFHGPVSDEEMGDQRAVAEHDRQFAALEDGAVVGGSMAATLRMSVPGGRAMAATGIQQVGVLPSHRRRGINTALMRAQLEDSRRRGESLAILHASEAAIYRRFGFGQATFLADLNVETIRAAFLPGYGSQGRVRLLPRHVALPRMRPVYDAVAASRPGMILVDDPWFAWRFAQVQRHGALPWFFAIHETDAGEPDAYAVYEVKHEWPGEIPQLELTVHELMAATPQATADIWRYVFDVDLVRTVSAGWRPVDDPLLWLVAEPRRLRFTLRDGLFVRLVDVPAALAARGYGGEGAVVFEVRDDFCPWNRGNYVLTASGGSAACSRTDEQAALACTVNELGATYLGGSTFAELATAGRVEERTQGALARADAIFRSAPAPWCSLPI
jgi:predicted acetyltransferase